MKLILVIAAILLLAGAGGGGYYYFIYNDKAAEDGAEGDKQAHGGVLSMFNQTQYVKLSPIYLPVLDEDGITQTVTIAITLAVPNDKAVEKVKHLEPRLHDAYIQNMYGMFNKKTIGKDGALPVKLIKERLNAISDEVVGDDDIIEEVLLQIVLQRAI